MLNNSDFETQGSLNDAFDLIKNIFEKERTSYEKTINSLKNKISGLEEALLKANKENMIYQTKISNLKRKLTSISKTVSKLEESDFEPKNENKENEKIDVIINKDNINNNNIKYRNKDKANSFRKKTKYITNINRSVNDNYEQFMNTNLLNIKNNNKQLNDGEDIKTNYNNKSNKPMKKSLSTKIKNSLLNNVEETENKISARQNNIFKNYARNEENHSLYLHSNGFSEKNKNIKLIENYDKRCNTNKVKYLSCDKYNQIEQKIKGIKSNLNIFKEKEETKLNDSVNDNSNSINEENIFS